MPLSPLLRRYDHALLDLDGCVWVGDEPTAGAVEAVTALRRAGKGIAFVTNDSRVSGEDLVRKLWGQGFQASLEEVVTVGGALQHMLAERADRLHSAFVIGSNAIAEHVAGAGLRVANGTEFATRADVVVVGLDVQLDYPQLRTAVQALDRGAELVATGRDPTLPMPDGPWPGTGSILAALEYATGRRAATVGKPDPQLFNTALDRLGEGRALVVGDRLDTDLAGAAAAGLDAAIVLTGAAARDEAEAARDPKPVAVADTLAALVLDGAAP
jgi:HAD superfamily hydrolase (TIGR01450 family)